MKLPNGKDAHISSEKLTEYILSETHIVGKLKAKFFRRAGFNETNISVFKKALLEIALTQEVKDVVSTIYGKKYVIDGEIISPKKMILKVRIVWIIEIGQSSPRFVTVYPV